MLVLRSVVDTAATPWAVALDHVGQGRRWGWCMLGSAIAGARDWPAWPAVVTAAHQHLLYRATLAGPRHEEAVPLPAAP